MTTTTRPVPGVLLSREWRYSAACLHVDPETFYPLDDTPTSPAVATAKAVCAGCPVRKVCLSDVMASEDPARRWGITGGLTPAERTARHLRQRHQHRQTVRPAEVAA